MKSKWQHKKNQRQRYPLGATMGLKGFLYCLPNHLSGESSILSHSLFE